MIRSVGVALLLAAAAGALFAPYALRGERFLCAPATGFPPWTSAAPAAPRPADYGATDQLVFMLPNDVHRARSWREDVGGLFWNPHQLCGTPFLATQDTFAFYPPSLIALAVEPADVFFWTALLHVFLAALGAAAALGRLELSMASRAIGGLAFGCGAWMVARLDYPNLVQTAAWAPWILYAADRAVVLRRTRDRALLATFVLLSTLAGMIQLTIVTLLVAGLLALVRAVGEFRRVAPAAALRGLGSALVGVLLGASLAAPQWLPTVDYARDGTRLGADAAALRPQCVRPVEWLSVADPALFGGAAALSRAAIEGRGIGTNAEEEFPPAKAFGLRGSGASFFESAVAPYGAMLALIVAAGFRRRKAALLGAGLVLFGAFASADSPLFALLHGAPGAAFGNPRRWLLVCALGFAAWTAAAADATPTRRGRRFAAAVPATLLVFGMLASLGASLFVERLAAASGATHEAALASFGFVAAGLLRGAGFSGAAWLSLFAPDRLRPWLLGLVLLAEAACFQLTHNPGQEREAVFPPTALTARLRAGEPTDAPSSRRMARLLGDADECLRLLGTPPTPHLLVANAPMIFRLRDVHGYEGVLNRRLEEVFEALEPGVVRDHHRIETFAHAASTASPLMDFLGVGSVLSQRTSAPGLRSVALFADERVALFENEGALPSETCVGSARVFKDDASLLRALVASDFDPSREVLLRDVDAAALGLPAADAEGRIKLADGGGAACEVRARGAADGRFGVVGGRLFVSAETFDPGFRYVDGGGRDHAVVRANHAFQAVFVPEGVEEISRKYRPRLWNAALAAAVCGVIALAADSRFRRPRALEPSIPPAD